jgi:hypothetical protein
MSHSEPRVEVSSSQTDDGADYDDVQDVCAFNCGFTK